MRKKFFRRIGFDSPQLKLSGYDWASLMISKHINFFNNYRIQTKTKLTPPKSEISLLLKIKFSANQAVFVLYAQSGKGHFRTAVSFIIHQGIRLDSYSANAMNRRTFVQDSVPLSSRAAHRPWSGRNSRLQYRRRGADRSYS